MTVSRVRNNPLDAPAVATALADLTWPAAERLREHAILVVPVGSTEQHGLHLPLSTDTDIAQGLAESLARCRLDVVVAPAVAYGSSGEHAGFTGTISVGQEATELFLLELGRSALMSFGCVFFLCAHGGNRQPVERAVQQLRAAGHHAMAYFPNWSLDAHAGRAETSLMLAVAPHRVSIELAAAGNVEPLPVLMPTLITGGVAAVSRNGVLGDPAGASADEGRRLLDGMVGEIGKVIDNWLSAP